MISLKIISLTFLLWQKLELRWLSLPWNNPACGNSQSHKAGMQSTQMCHGTRRCESLGGEPAGHQIPVESQGSFWLASVLFLFSIFTTSASSLPAPNRAEAGSATFLAMCQSLAVFLSSQRKRTVESRSWGRGGEKEARRSAGIQRARWSPAQSCPCKTPEEAWSAGTVFFQFLLLKLPRYKGRQMSRVPLGPYTPSLSMSPPGSPGTPAQGTLSKVTATAAVSFALWRPQFTLDDTD